MRVIVEKSIYSFAMHAIHVVAILCYLYFILISRDTLVQDINCLMWASFSYYRYFEVTAAKCELLKMKLEGLKSLKNHFRTFLKDHKDEILESAKDHKEEVKNIIK